MFAITITVDLCKYQTNTTVNCIVLHINQQLFSMLHMMSFNFASAYKIFSCEG